MDRSGSRTSDHDKLEKHAYDVQYNKDCNDLELLDGPQIIPEVMRGLNANILVYSLHLLGAYLRNPDTCSVLLAFCKDSDCLATWYGCIWRW